MTTSDRHTQLVREVLHAHAARGALREFQEQPARSGKHEFRFTWLLDQRFTLVFDPAKSQLILRDLLPNIPARSHLDRAIRDFTAARSDKKLPAHRRIDPSRATLTCRNRGSKLGFLMDVKRSQYRYAVPKLLNFCNELFGYLDMNHIQYLWENMGVPEE